jgi:replicative DNA helicase
VLESGLELIRCAPVEVLPAEIRNETIEQLDAISSNQIPQTTRAVTIGDAAREAMTNLSDAIQRNGQLAGITFGLSDLDRRTSGIHRSEVSILAARPGMGKTAVGVHVALKAAESGAHVLYCSLEMTAAALAQRALTALAFKCSAVSLFRSTARQSLARRRAVHRLATCLGDSWRYYRRVITFRVLTWLIKQLVLRNW